MPTFPTPAPISATIDLVQGDIHVVAEDRTDTVVDVEPIDPSRHLDVRAAEQVTTTFADGALRVRHSTLRTAFTTKYGSVRVVVHLPTGSDVRGETTDGEYTVHGTAGSCRLTNTIGDIRIARADQVRVNTTGGRVTVDHAMGHTDVRGGGDIRLGRVDGHTTVKTTTGDITVDQARAAVTAKTTTGHIRLGEIATGTVDVSTVIGTLDVGVGPGTAVDLDAHTTTGQVHDHLPTPEQPDRAVTVRARCTGGDITVHPVRTGRAQHQAEVRRH